MDVHTVGYLAKFWPGNMLMDTSLCWGVAYLSANQK